MRNLFGCLTVAALLLVVVSPAAVQDATPAGGPAKSDVSLLAALGHPDLLVFTDGGSITPLPEITAGRYRLVLQNSSDSLKAELELFRVPNDTTYDALIAELAAESAATQTVPESFYKLTIAGGASAEPLGIGETIVELAPGDWVYNLSVYSDTGNIPPKVLPLKVSVTGEMPRFVEPSVDVSVNMIDLAFEIPDSVPAGAAVWQVTNSGKFPHFLEIDSYPEPMTAEQVQATLDAMFGMPTTQTFDQFDLLHTDNINRVTGTTHLSNAHTNWIEANLPPGNYLAVCFASGPGDVPIHAALGMFKIFTVE